MPNHFRCTQVERRQYPKENSALGSAVVYASLRVTQSGTLCRLNEGSVSACGDSLGAAPGADSLEAATQRAFSRGGGPLNPWRERTSSVSERSEQRAVRGSGYTQKTSNGVTIPVTTWRD
jgi:hypothetical protein